MNIFQQIVNEIHKPFTKKRYIPLTRIPVEYSIFVSPEEVRNDVFLFVEKNIIFKMTTLTMDSDQRWKSLNREFQSMNILFDSLFILSKKEDQYRLRVPLSSILDYKGFRCLAVGIIPI
jgi:hypothetical protein